MSNFEKQQLIKEAHQLLNKIDEHIEFIFKTIKENRKKAA